ncbi:MAG: type II toxin-antitoxin system HicA family toxin [Planctomycetota bacterium]
MLTGRQDQNIRFTDLTRLLIALGFDERTRGSHHIFTRPNVEDILNLQPRSDGKAKAYQVKQVRNIVTRHKLALD